MAKKIMVMSVPNPSANGTAATPTIIIFENTTGVIEVVQDIAVELLDIDDETDFSAATQAAVLAFANGNGYPSLTAADVLWAVARPGDALATFANPSRSFNSNFTISATRNAKVQYSINAAWTLNALLAGTATAFLEYSMDAGSSWTTVNQVSKTLSLLTTGGADDMNLVGEIPAGALVRIRTSSTNMTLTFTRGQEVLG